jgi:hypothetical protein
VEADDDDPPARREHVERGVEPVAERLELVVGGDAKRLEDALGGMALAEPGRRRNS